MFSIPADGRDSFRRAMGGYFCFFFLPFSGVDCIRILLISKAIGNISQV